MKSKRSRLDRFLSQKLSINRRDARLLLAQGRVWVDRQPATSIQQAVDEYTHVQFDQHILQDNQPCYIQLHKPKGVVSATKDPIHTTVVDLLPTDRPHNLHIVGRLDYNSTGLLLLTNDGRWSRRLTEPSAGINKRYLVTLDKAISQTVIDAFQTGIYFAYENITTLPATLTLISPLKAEVSLKEGRYHQIKRMFGHFQIQVLTLHRLSVGNLLLDPHLSEGESRDLNNHEVKSIFIVESDK